MAFLYKLTKTEGYLIISLSNGEKTSFVEIERSVRKRYNETIFNQDLDRVSLF